MLLQPNPPAPTHRARVAPLAALTLALLASAPAGPARSAPAATPTGQSLLLHVPSPDWRDQILYFALTDRFDDADPTNNDQGAGEFRAGSRAHYNGGDLAGLRRRLDYIQGLGVTGLWITPPVLNQWWNGNTRYAGYHGYWASDFSQVDPHLGTLDDYRLLSDALHRRGMTLVQDIVVNHTGDYFDYRGGWRAQDPAAFWTANEGSRPTAQPAQAPFDRNDPRDPAQRAEGIYHWTPDVRDYSNPDQMARWQMSGLDDLNTDNPVVRRALRASYGHWIREVGVDAFRVDTALYVPPAFFEDFLYRRDAQAPGIRQVARATGRHDFFSFGEGFAIDRPMQTRAMRQIEAYVTGPRGQPRLQGMLNFPLYGSLSSVIARGAPTQELAHRITALMREHRDPHRLPSFLDNHDVDRFLAGGSTAALQQALLALMSLPGIPVLYYGTEQGFTAPRAAMFAAGYGSGGRDHFDIEAPLYRFVQRVTALRRAHPTLSRGRPVVLRDDAAGPGVLAWRMDPPQGSDADALLVLLNTAERRRLLDGLPTGQAAGAVLPMVFAIDDTATELRAGPGGLLTVDLPARAGLVLRLPRASHRLASAPPHPASAPLTLDRLEPQAHGEAVTAYGKGTPGRALQVVLNGDSQTAVQTTPDAHGRWAATLDTRTFTDPRVRHRVVAWDPGTDAVSAARPLRVHRPWRLLATQADPAGDDHGRAMDGRRLAYPRDASWGRNRQMDLRQVRVWGAGDALKIEVDTQRLTRSWNPALGFDHVAFTIFIGQPSRPGGVQVMPQQNGELPDGMRWQWRLRAHGWSNALFSADGADATHEGRPVSPGAGLAVDAQRNRVTFTLPGGMLGSLDGVQVYVTTWDYDGGYRALDVEPGTHTMGGGPGTKVMDDVGPMTLRTAQTR